MERQKAAWFTRAAIRPRILGSGPPAVLPVGQRGQQKGTHYHIISQYGLDTPAAKHWHLVRNP